MPAVDLEKGDNHKLIILIYTMKRRKALIHIAIGTGTLGFMPFCTTNPYQAFSLLPLTKKQFETIIQLSKLMVPTKENTFATPEDRTTFLLTMLQDLQTDEEIQTFAEGVRALESLAIDFKNPNETLILLGSHMEEGSAQGAALRTIKQFSLRHFMTAQAYMETVQGYEFIPGRYEGCVAKN